MHSKIARLIKLSHVVSYLLLATCRSTDYVVIPVAFFSVYLTNLSEHSKREQNVQCLTEMKYSSVSYTYKGHKYFYSS